MGLIGWAHSRATSRPHVLLLEEPGGTAPRLALERSLRERGWPQVDSPADADVLALAGNGDLLEGFVARIWEQLPGPRVQITLDAPEDAGSTLDRARDSLQDIASQRLDADSRQSPATGAMPAGLAMADRAPDRDGLQLDVLGIPWGPALAWWPPGLVVTSRMHGDVLAEVEASRIGAPDPAAAHWQQTAYASGPARAGAAARLDALSRLLAVAGWEAERLRAQRIRDDLLAGEPDPALVTRLERLARRVVKSRPLAWMTHGIGIVGESDATSRYRSWLSESLDAVRSGTVSPGIDMFDEPLDVLPGILGGIEVSAMRLAVASLDPWLTGALPRAGVSHA